MVPGVAAESSSKLAKTPDPSIHIPSLIPSKLLQNNEKQCFRKNL